MVKWISLHAAARKGLPMLGRSLAKQKSNCVFYFWGLFLVWHLVGESLGAGNTHWGVSEGSAGVCERWAHLGYHWVHTGTRAVKQSGSEVHGYNNASPPAHFTAALFFFFSFYWFPSSSFFSLSTGIITWGTYWKFWHAQIWNRSPIFSSILKVSFLFK